MAERRRHTWVSNREMLGRFLALGLLAAVVLGLTYMALRFASEIEAARQNGQSFFDLDKSPAGKEVDVEGDEEMEDRPDEDGFIPGGEEEDMKEDEETDGSRLAPSPPPLSGSDGAPPLREQ
jgi:hypothetical protein